MLPLYAAAIISILLLSLFSIYAFAVDISFFRHYLRFHYDIAHCFHFAMMHFSLIIFATPP